MPVVENLLIFYSPTFIDRLKNANTWAIDGTFDVVPRPYYQLLTIGFIVDTHILPVIYCVLPDKLQNTYTSIFRIINNMIGTCNPIHMKGGF